MEKMWAGRTDGALSKIADDFNSSIHIDARMYKEDITGSLAHSAMLCAKGIISEEDYLAFPYGREVKEGAPTREGTWETLYGY